MSYPNPHQLKLKRASKKAPRPDPDDMEEWHFSHEEEDDEPYSFNAVDPNGIPGGNLTETAEHDEHEFGDMGIMDGLGAMDEESDLEEEDQEGGEGKLDLDSLPEDIRNEILANPSQFGYELPPGEEDAMGVDFNDIPPEPASDPSVKRYDFRQGSLPDGVQVVGGEAVLEQMRDHATCLHLPPLTFLRLPEVFAPVSGQPPYVTDYTVSMDVFFEQLPPTDCALFQANRGDGFTSGEAFVYRNGGVGAYGEVGVESVRPGRWNRVTVTMGPAHLSEKKDRTAMRSALEKAGYALDGLTTEQEDQLYAVYTGKVAHDPSGGFGADPTRKALTTYVNGKMCARITSEFRRVMEEEGGRFSLNINELFLFASSEETSMPGLRVKFVEIRKGCFTPQQVKEHAMENRIFSFYDIERKQKLKEMRQNLCLRALYKKPPPVFYHPGFLGMFGDAFLQNTGLEGGNIGVVSAMMDLTFDRLLLVANTSIIGSFTHEEMQIVNYVSHVLKEGKDLARKFVLAQRSGAQFVHYLRRFKKRLLRLTEGETMMVPGGNNGHALMYIVEKEGEDDFRFSIVNTHPLRGLEYHPVNGDSHPKLKYKTVMSIPHLRYDKIMDDAFWTFLLKMAVFASRQNTSDKIYDLLLPYLAEKEIDQVWADTLKEDDCCLDWRSPQRAEMSPFRSLIETVHYLCRKRGLSKLKTKLLMLSIRMEMLTMASNDLDFLEGVTDSDRRIIRIACDQTASTAVKLSKALSSEQLAMMYAKIKTLVKKADGVPTSELITPADPPHLDLQSDTSSANQDDLLHPFYERLQRLEDVDGLAGPPITYPTYVPIDTLLIPKKVTCFEDAITAIRQCDKLSTLIAVQTHCIKNRPFLIATLIQYVFTQVVPMPKPSTAPDYEQDIWTTPVRYALQLDVLILLQRIMEHFAASAFAIANSRSFDAVRIIVPACICAVGDVMLRKVATDIPSELCEVFTLGNGGRGYGISTGHFGTQSETIEVHTPELHIARTAVLDYFESQRVERIMNWEETSEPEPPCMQFFSEICTKLAFPQGELPVYLADTHALIMKNFPEFVCYRDIAFYMKFFQNTDTRCFPGQADYTQRHAELIFQLQQDGYVVQGFGSVLSPRPLPPLSFAALKHRYPSYATPSFLTDPHEVRTEDDVLHIKNLPDFENCIGQQDSELLISYLTVPYIRVPLVLSFFATEDRIHALRNEDLQKVLDSVMFEPGRYLQIHMNQEPVEVPTRDDRLLATPYGLLLNELHRSPQVILDSIKKLMKLALDLDTGTVHSTTVPVILYVIKLATRVDNHISFLIEHTEGKHDCVDMALRDTIVFPDVLRTLKEGLHSIRAFLRKPVHLMLEAWCYELMKECEGVDDDDSILDRNTRIACNLHAHMLLVFRNVKHYWRDLSFDSVSTIKSSLVFLTVRHTWNLNILTIPETEIYELLAVTRRRLIEWTRKQNQYVLNQIMESIVRVTAGTGIRKPRKNDILDQNRIWAFVRGARNVGRFTVLSNRRGIHVKGDLAMLEDDNDEQEEKVSRMEEEEEEEELQSHSEIHYVPYDHEFGIEIDFQTIQLTLRSSHMKALETNIASNVDVRLIFGTSKSMQASTVESCQHREWVHLVGRNHDIHWWRTPDPRPEVVELDRDYAPGELYDSEDWIIPIFEPVRLSYLVEPFELQICLPELALPEDADVAYMVGIHPKNNGTWKEIYVFKQLRVVHIYNVLSHGRRFYRSLEYTSDARFTLREMQPAPNDRNAPWPRWERYGAGHPYAAWPDPTSCVIFRAWDHPSNLSGGQEQFLPERLLYGTVPSALLDRYLFWQDEEDHIRGYPISSQEDPYLLYIQLRKTSRVEAIKGRGVTATIKRLMKQDEETLCKRANLLMNSILDADFLLDQKATPSYSFYKKVRSLCESFPTIGSDENESIARDDIKELLSLMPTNGTYDHEGDVLATLHETLVSYQMGKDLSLSSLSSSSHEDRIRLVRRHQERLQNEMKRSKTLDLEELVLIDLMYAKPGTKLWSLAQTIVRIENLSYVLLWTKASSMEAFLQRHSTIEGYLPLFDDSLELHLLELPRLKMSFHEKKDETGYKRLYSMDHVDLFVSNYRSDLTRTLMTGLPQSLLLSNTNNELQILLPSIEPIRPAIGSCPFSTELVLHRANGEWYANLDTNYYLYPIHVSLSFLFSPTLASSLYIMLMRFLNRNYEAVYRLADSVATDMDYSPEEAMIFNALGYCNPDFHPDAHACRLKVSLVTLDSPVQLPWDLTKEASQYVQKLNHVSTTCRLELDEELQLMESVICDVTDPRFDPRIYNVYEITINKNRKFYLRALLKGQSDHAPVFYVPFGSSSHWMLYSDVSALEANSNHWEQLTVEYAAPTSMSGIQALDTINGFWSGSETLAGENLNCGFLFLYELLTGTKKAKFCSEDVSFNTALILSELLFDKREPSMMGSILNILTRCPQIIPRMPRYKDSRKYKNTTVNGWGDDNEPISPLAELFSQIIPILYSSMDVITSSFQQRHEVLSSYEHLEDPSESCSIKFGRGKRDWIVPGISNFQCSERSLRAVTIDTIMASQPQRKKEELDDQLRMGFNSVISFSTAPLRPINVSQFIEFKKRSDMDLPPVGDRLPFDVSQHKEAKSAVALSMMDRLRNDMIEYASQQNEGVTPKLTFLPDEKIYDIETSKNGQLDVSWLQSVQDELNGLVNQLETLRDEDAYYVDCALSWIRRVANHVDLPYDEDEMLSKEEILSGVNFEELEAKLREEEEEEKKKKDNTSSSSSSSFEMKQEDGKDEHDEDDEDETSESAKRKKYIFVLNRFCRQETTMWLEFLFGSLLSSKQIEDLRLLNPFLSPDSIWHLSDVLVACIFHANRVGCINRCISDARDLSKIIDKLCHASTTITSLMDKHQHHTNDRTEDEDYNEEKREDEKKVEKQIRLIRNQAPYLVIKGESLARNLVTRRYFVVKNGDTTIPEVDDPSDLEALPNDDHNDNEHSSSEDALSNMLSSPYYAYDPRFLLFEFTWNILLRKMQVVLVREFMSSMKKGVSLVKQMIMGMGKTTVVAPLMTLMLADSNQLVMQVVPPALLEFSRSVMRATFSSIMHKRIYTLHFDRATDADPKVLNKLQNSVKNMGVIISTPTTVKSIMLKFLEVLDLIRDESRPRHPSMEVDVHEMSKILRLFRDGILLMDEVDLILHPMKSELNFPIGSKNELDFSPQRWQLPVHILDAIFYAETDKMSVGFHQSRRAFGILDRLKDVIQEGYAQRALQKNPHIVLLNPDWYHEHMKPIMVDWIHLWLEAQHLSGLSEDDIKLYVLEGANQVKNADLAERILASDLTKVHKKMLNLAHDWVRSYLPHVLRKIDRVSFGIMNTNDYERAIKNDPKMPRTRAKLAIPFVGKDVPSHSSEFAHPDVIIGLTILAYRYEGLRWTDFEDIVSNMKATLSKELGPWDMRKSSLRYAKWIEDAGGIIRGRSHYLDELDDVNAKELITNDMKQEEDDDDDNDDDDVSTEQDDQENLDIVLDDDDAFNDYDDEKEVVPLRLLKQSNRDQMVKLFNLLMKHPDTIHWYLESFIFPTYMTHQIVKLSACGQEVGGDMLFKKRIGFSGTPSDLLPVELGKCGYEKGSDGQMINVMTSPNVVSYEIIPDGWSVDGLLRRIAKAKNPRFNALIDTGALVTGLSNYQVAQALLKYGMEWCEGVVFLDEYDRKMILVRATGRVLKMAQCGIPAHKRFAFYDQVHTTGMDIKHTLNAKAILTLGKDMVFRDYVQGAYRMRQIGKGQTIHLFIIPEVAQLMHRELRKAGYQNPDFHYANELKEVELPIKRSKRDWSITSQGSIIESKDEDDGIGNKLVLGHIEENGMVISQENNNDIIQLHRVLIDVNAWLVVSSMASERIQFNQLCLQNVANVWRKHAFGQILDHHQEFRITNPTDPALERALDVFCEPIDFKLESSVPEPVMFSETIERRVKAHDEFIEDNEDNQGVIQHILRLVGKTMLDDVDRALTAEMVQEQEEEKEKQQEQEQEQEIEIEKYVDLAYQRDNEEPTPWLFNTLAYHPSEEKTPQFYPCNEFKLYKRRPLSFPDYLLVSNNYFDKRWSGARRIKNVVMVLEWLPDANDLSRVLTSYEPLSEQQETKLLKAIELFSDSERITLTEFKEVLRCSAHLDLPKDELIQLFLECASFGETTNPQEEKEGEDADKVITDAIYLTVDQLRHIIVSGRFSTWEKNRHFVAVSLAEAETIRRIMHLRLGSPILGVSELSLRCVPAGFILTDVSKNFQESLEPFNTPSAYQSLRFLNCDMYFNEQQLNVLIRSLHYTTPRERRNFFIQVMGCRRRLSKRWNETPVSRMFTLSDQFGMLKMRSISVKFRKEIKRSGLLMYDAFNKFDFDRNGFLSPGELWGAFNYLNIQLTAYDVVEYLNWADVDKDGNLSYKEFVDSLQDPDSGGKEGQIWNDDDENDTLLDVDSTGDGDIDAFSGHLILNHTPSLIRQASGNLVEPYCEDELLELREKLANDELREEEELEKLEEHEERKIREELEKEEDERDRTQEGGRNPRVDESGAHFDFSTGRRPRYTNVRGDVHYKEDHLGSSYFKVYAPSSLFIGLPFMTGGNGGGHRTNQYTVSMYVKFESLPSARAGLISCCEYNETDALLFLYPNGQLVFNNGSTSLDGNYVQPNRYYTITVVVDVPSSTLQCYLDQQLVATRFPDEEHPLLIDGIESIHNQMTFMSSRGEGESNGGDVKYIWILKRSIIPDEVAHIHERFNIQAKAKLIEKLTEDLINMGVNEGVAQWAAQNAQGDTEEALRTSAMEACGMNG